MVNTTALADMSIGDVLEQARELAAAGNYAEALVFYEYFFDHSLDNDSSFAGVRLSYCLDEWVRLGEKYPPARQRIEQKAQDSLKALIQTRDPLHFFDFKAICENLQREEEPVQQFLHLHETDPDLAEQVSRFIWDELVERKLWTVCAVYLHDSTERYAALLDKFDISLRLREEDPLIGGDGFVEHVKDWYVRDMSHLLLVMNHTNQQEKARLIYQRARADMVERGCPELIDCIDLCINVD